jgi:O-antigen ligase
MTVFCTFKLSKNSLKESYQRFGLRLKLLHCSSGVMAFIAGRIGILTTVDIVQD